MQEHERLGADGREVGDGCRQDGAPRGGGVSSASPHGGSPGGGQGVLGSRQAPQQFGRGLNNRGVVVGASDTSEGVQHAFLWNPGDPATGAGAHMEDLAKADGRYLGGSSAYGTNDAGLVVGAMDTARGRRAFVWDPAKRAMRPLPALPGAGASAGAINEQGLVIGGCGGAPAFWDLGRDPVTCQSILGGPLTSDGERAYAINNEGQIVGSGHDLVLTSVAFLRTWDRDAGVAQSPPFDFTNWEPWGSTTSWTLWACTGGTRLSGG